MLAYPLKYNHQPWYSACFYPNNSHGYPKGEIHKDSPHKKYISQLCFHLTTHCHEIQNKVF